MTTLAEIHATLDRNVRSGQPVLAGVLTRTLPGDLSGLVLADAKLLPERLSPSTRAVTVSGKTDVLGIRGLGVAASFTERDDRNLVLDLRVESSSDYAPQVSWLPVTLPVTGVALTLTTTGLGAEYETLTAAIGATIHLDTLPFKVLVRPPLGDAEDWVLEGDFESITLSAGLGQLTKLAGGDPGWVHDLPPQLTGLGGFSIRDVRMTFRPTPLPVSVSQVSLEAASTGPIDIVPGKLSIAGVRISLDIWNATDKDQRAIRGTFAGEVRVGGLGIDIRAEVPDLRFYGSLAEGSSVSLRGVVHDLLPGVSLPADVPDIVLHDLNVMVDARNRSFSLYARCFSDWEVVSKVRLTAVQVDLAVTRDRPDAEASPSATITGTFSVGGVDVTLSADHPRSGDGWQFDGSTGSGQDIPIKSVVGDLAKLFDVTVALPPVLETFSIRNLALSFNTGSKDLTFTCGGKFEIEGTEVDCVVTIKVEHLPNVPKPEIRLHGDVTVGGSLTFSGEVSRDPSAQAFVATYRPTPPARSEDIDIKQLVERISPELGRALPVLRIGLKEALFVYEKTAAAPAFLFGLAFDVGAKIDLSNVGAIGSLLGGQEIGLEDVRILVASADLSTDRVKRLNGRLPSGIEKLPEPAAQDGEAGSQIALGKGFNLSGKLTLGTLTPPPLLLSAGAGRTSAPGADAAAAAGAAGGKPGTPTESPAEASPAKWIDIKKSLGPLYVSRVGVLYRQQKLGLLLDAAVDLAGVHVGLSGFQVRFALQAAPTWPEFGLDGLELSYAGGPLQITGSFLRVSPPDAPAQFDGMALINAAKFAITGFGSYTTVAGEPSLFIFALLHAELGGPPFFRVRGLAAGFGYNRALRLPPIEEVHTFPLVRAALDETFIAKDSPQQSIQTAMGKLRDYISPAPGDYWLAAGVRFSSFEMIHSFALLSVSFGHQVEIGLLGLSRMSLPKDAKPGSELAYAELALRVVVKPEEGTVAVEGRLTGESYVFSKDCRLTGGFAFFLWSSGQHAGDFVVTLGGYHPEFPRPAHYPLVPRLGINWQVSSELAVTAEMYFALTPSCLMAGGKLSAVYNSGSIRAWFVAYVDFLLGWQPVHYTLSTKVCIGVQVTLELISIHVELDVGLRLWGPPFAGQIDVDLDVVSFSVHFGELRTPPARLDAAGFAKAFLPPARVSPPSPPTPTGGGFTAAQWNVLTTRIESGLIRQEAGPGNAPIRVVNAHALALSVESLIPVGHFEPGGLAPKDGNGAIKASGLLGVRPMGTTRLQSGLSVGISRIAAGSPAGASRIDAARDNLRVSTIENGIPEALWSKVPEEGKIPEPAPEAKTITATAGIRISFAPRDPKGALPAMELAQFGYETYLKSIPWDDKLGPAPPLLAGEVGDGGSRPVMSDVMSGQTTRRRDAVLEVLARQSPFALNTVDLAELVRTRDSYFQADPVACRLGSRTEAIA